MVVTFNIVLTLHFTNTPQRSQTLIYCAAVLVLQGHSQQVYKIQNPNSTPKTMKPPWQRRRQSKINNISTHMATLIEFGKTEHSSQRLKTHAQKMGTNPYDSDHQQHLNIYLNQLK